MENVKKEEIEKIVGIDKANIFYDIVNEITKLYDMEQIWNNGGKKWTYEYKFRKGGKTLCAFYFKDNTLGGMIIFGKDERTKFEEIQSIKIPTLVIAGKKDIIKESHTREIANNIPNANLSIIKGNHFIANKKSETFNQEVEKFLIKTLKK